MFKNSMDLISKLILIITFSLVISYSTQSLESNDEETRDKTAIHELCMEGKVDVVVVLDDGDIYMFRRKKFWKFFFNRRMMDLELAINRTFSISEDWKNLTNFISSGFTVQRSEIPNPIAGHTFFIKGKNYYLFKNRINVRNGSIQYWGENNWKNIRYVATPKNTSIVIVNNYGEIPKRVSTGQTYTFDDPNFPEKLGKYEIMDKYLDIFDWKSLKYLMPLPYDQTYLAIFEFRDYSGYCVMNNLKSNCNIKPVHQLIDCPLEIFLLKENNFIYYLWNTTGLNIDEILVILSGGSLASLLINILLITISLIRYIELN